MTEQKEIALFQQNPIIKTKTNGREKVRCESTKHNAFCHCLNCQKPKESCRDCPNVTKQHKVPKCIARDILGWTEAQIDDNSNILWQSGPCHVDADRHIMKQYSSLLKQLDGGKIPSAEEVLAIRHFS